MMPSESLQGAEAEGWLDRSEHGVVRADHECHESRFTHSAAKLSKHSFGQEFTKAGTLLRSPGPVGQQ